jgi:hypothetical protein
MKSLILLFCLIAFGVAVAGAQQDVVPDADTAVKVARAALVARYGKANTDTEEPLVARMKDSGIWIVTGTIPQGVLGGVGEVEIARSDGRILRLVHGQ